MSSRAWLKETLSLTNTGGLGCLYALVSRWLATPVRASSSFVSALIVLALPGGSSERFRDWSVTFGELRLLRSKWAADHADPENLPELNVSHWLFEDDEVGWEMVAICWRTRLDAFEVREMWEVRQEGIEREREDWWNWGRHEARAA